MVPGNFLGKLSDSGGGRGEGGNERNGHFFKETVLVCMKEMRRVRKLKLVKGGKRSEQWRKKVRKLIQ